jgi:hypothetical protein
MTKNPEEIDVERLNQLKSAAAKLGYVIRGTDTSEVYQNLPEVRLHLVQRLCDDRGEKQS